jgi:hypothetical protein
MSIPNVNKTRISVVTKPTNVSISSVGIRGKAGEMQNLSNYAVLNGGNTFNGNQYISGSVQISDTLNFATGSFINSQIQIEAFLTNYILLEIVNYSSSSIDDLTIGTYNISNGVPAPWTAFRLEATTLPVTSIEVNDILAGTSIIPSTIQAKGGSGFGDIVVVNLDLTGLLQILPLTGSNFQLLRPLVKPALTIETPNGTDIFLNSQGLGDAIINTNVVPLTNATNKLGLPTRRWKEVWVGSGSIYMQDETLGIDLRMTARDGDFVVDGAAGMQIGEFTLKDNQIKIKDPNRQIIIGQQIASGSVVFNRPIQVNTFAGNSSFIVDKSGRTQLIVPNIPAGDVGAFSIVGNQSNKFQPVTSAGGMVHITGNDGQVTRVNLDAFGSGSTTSFNGIIARAARGTAAAPSQSKEGDVTFRLAASGWRGDTGFGGTTIVGGATTTLDFVVLEDQMNNARGSAQQFYNAPIGTRTRQLSAQIDTNGLIVPNIPTNNTATQVLVWDSVSGRVGKQSGASNLDGGAAASVYLSVTEELNGGGA